MPYYNFDADTINKYKKELETGSSIGSSDEYKTLLTAFDRFSRFYTSDQPNDSVGEEMELTNNLLAAAADYYNKKGGQQHNDTRTTRMNAALKIYDMVDSEVNEPAIVFNNPPVQYNMEEDRQRIQQELAATANGNGAKSAEANKKVDDYIYNSVMNSDNPTEDNPQFFELVTRFDGMKSLRNNLMKFDAPLGVDVYAMYNALEQIPGAIFKELVSDVDKIFVDEDTQAKAGMFHYNTLVSLRNGIDNLQYIPDISYRAFTEGACYALDPDIRPNEDDVFKDLYNTIKLQEHRYDGRHDILKWTQELFADQLKQKYSSFTKDFYADMKKLQAGLQAPQAANAGQAQERAEDIAFLTNDENIERIKNFSGSIEDIKYLQSCIAKIGRWQLTDSEKIEDYKFQSVRMDNTLADYSKLEERMKPVSEFEKKINAADSIIKKIGQNRKDLIDRYEKVQTEVNVNNYFPMRDAMNESIGIMDQLRAVGYKSDFDMEYDDLDPDLSETTQKCQDRREEEMTERMKKVDPEFEYESRHENHHVSAEKFIRSCGDTVEKMEPYLQAVKTPNQQYEDLNADLTQKLRKDVAASSEYKDLLGRLKTKVENMGSFRDKKATLQCLERMSKQITRFDNDGNPALRCDSVVDEKDLKTLHDIAEKLIQNGRTEPVVGELAQLSSPAEEYPYIMQVKPIVSIKDRLDSFKEKLDNATSAFSRDSGEFTEMMTNLKDLQQYVNGILEGNHRNIDYNDSVLNQKIGTLRTSAAKYVGAKLTQDKNANRQSRFTTAEDIMDLKTIAEQNAPENGPRKVNSVPTTSLDELVNDCKTVETVFKTSKVGEQIEEMKKNADVIHATNLRIENLQYISKDDFEHTLRTGTQAFKDRAMAEYSDKIDVLHKDASMIKGMDTVCDIMKKEDDAWGVLQNKNASEIEQVRARTDILMARGIRNYMADCIAKNDGGKSLNTFYEEIGSSWRKIVEMKAEILTKQSTARIVQSINEEGLAKQDKVKQAFTGSKTLSVPDMNDPHI